MLSLISYVCLAMGMGNTTPVLTNIAPYVTLIMFQMLYIH